MFDGLFCVHFLINHGLFTFQFLFCSWFEKNARFHSSHHTLGEFDNLQKWLTLFLSFLLSLDYQPGNEFEVVHALNEGWLSKEKPKVVDRIQLFFQLLIRIDSEEC